MTKVLNTLAVTAMMLAGSSAYAGLIHATTVVDFNQGLTVAGNAVASNRSNPLAALGAPQDNDTINFVSLGIGGSLVLGFGESFTTDSVMVWETTYGNPSNYPEAARLFVGSGSSAETASWTFVADILNSEDARSISLRDIDTGSTGGIFEFVMLVDITDTSIHGGGADGFDVDAVSVVSVPTPGAAALAAFGLGIGATGRRRDD